MSYLNDMCDEYEAINIKHISSDYDKKENEKYANEKEDESKYDEYNEYNKYNNYNENNSYFGNFSDMSISDYDFDEPTDYFTSYKFKNYKELIELTNQEDTPDKISNIITGLIKAITIKKCKETSLNFDFSLGTYETWIKYVETFNNINIGVDYRMLIDEDAIVCYLLNEELIE